MNKGTTMNTTYHDKNFILIDSYRDDQEPNLAGGFPETSQSPYKSPAADPKDFVLVGKDRTGGRGHNYWLYVRRRAFPSLSSLLNTWKDLPIKGTCKQLFSIPFRIFENTIQVYEDQHKGIIIGRKGWQIKALSAAIGQRVLVGRTICLILDSYNCWAIVRNIDDFPQYKGKVWYWKHLGIKTEDAFFVDYYKGRASSDCLLYMDAKFTSVLDNAKPYREE